MAVPRVPTYEEYAQLVEALQKARHPLPLDSRQIEEVARRTAMVEVLRGEVLIEQDTPADFLYFITSGQMRALDVKGAEPELLNFHTARAFVGEHGMLSGEPRTATVDAVSDSKLACWDSADFEWMLDLNEEMRPYFEQVYQQRILRSKGSFPGKQWDEAIIVKTGKHVLTLIDSLLAPAFLLILGLGLIIVSLWLIINETGLLAVIGLASGLIVSPVAILWIALNYINWRNDEYIVTSKRVIHIERYIFYGEQWDEAPLIRIQDVTVEAHNWLQRMVDYHDLVIKTAGAGIIRFTGLPDAQHVHELIFQERAKAMDRRSAADKTSIRIALAQKTGAEIPEAELPAETLVAPTPTQASHETRRLLGPLDYFLPRTRVVDGDTITWRKHWIVWLKKTWLPLILTLLFTTVTVVVLVRLIIIVPIFGLELNLEYALPGFLVLAAACFIWYAYQYDGWHKDIYIVTRDRIIDVDSSAFRIHGESRREGTFDVIQNITYAIPGFVYQLLNMGSIVIETAGTAETFTFDSVFSPSSVQQEIFNRWVSYQERQTQREQAAQVQRMSEWIGEYHQMQQANPSPRDWHQQPSD